MTGKKLDVRPLTIKDHNFVVPKAVADYVESLEKKNAPKKGVIDEDAVVERFNSIHGSIREACYNSKGSIIEITAALELVKSEFIFTNLQMPQVIERFDLKEK